VFCYFKHEEKGIGPRYAERMAELLGLPGAVAGSAGEPPGPGPAVTPEEARPA